MNYCDTIPYQLHRLHVLTALIEDMPKGSRGFPINETPANYVLSRLTQLADDLWAKIKQAEASGRKE